MEFNVNLARRVMSVTVVVSDGRLRRHVALEREPRAGRSRRRRSRGVDPQQRAQRPTARPIRRPGRAPDDEAATAEADAAAEDTTADSAAADSAAAARVAVLRWTRTRCARKRDAMRDILVPPDHLTIVQTDSMIVLTRRRRPHRRALAGRQEGERREHAPRAQDEVGWREAGVRDPAVSATARSRRPSRSTPSITSCASPRKWRIRAVRPGQGRRRRRTITHVYDADAR